jgi:hypothetical protein
MQHLDIRDKRGTCAYCGFSAFAGPRCENRAEWYLLGKAAVYGLCAVVSGVARFTVRLWYAVNADTIVKGE